MKTKATKLLLNATLLILVMSIIRLITGASDLTSVGTASAALLLSVPIVLAGLGGLFSERSGVVNIGLEGMMILGAWAGGFIGSKHGPWLGLAGAILTSVNNKNTEAIKNQIKVVAQAYPSLQYGTFLTNHDQDRVYTQLGNDTSKMKLAAAQYLTLPGVPFIYYGEEVGMIGSGADENKRKPMQWTAGTNAGFSTQTPWQTLGANYTTNNVQTLSLNKNSIWNYYQKLIQARNENEALRKGYVLILDNQKNTNIGFARIYNQTAILSVSNFSNTNTSDSLSLGISTLSAGNYQASNLLTGENLGILTINNVGGFTNWAIQANTLKASSNVLIKLTNTNTGIVSDKLKKFTMSPNPAQTQIQFDLKLDDGDVDLVIYDSNGKQMQAQKINHTNHSINIDKLTTGVFFVKISNKKFTQIERLLKQ